METLGTAANSINSGDENDSHNHDDGDREHDASRMTINNKVTTTAAPTATKTATVALPPLPLTPKP